MVGMPTYVTQVVLWQHIQQQPTNKHIEHEPVTQQRQHGYIGSPLGWLRMPMDAIFCFVEVARSELVSNDASDRWFWTRAPKDA